ncbi:hypothetical protein [Streptomyces acidiscabies]|uniref:hypothetical protein n=1 Tax=Streptomyces acidiscabies TaxID=42234 RepID=UPI0009616666|nr:hypothetical protein [Streptomyces acidiscabies]GAV38275.1 hypothetical protein Saa2_01154 [Streptomyces acidiscabies]
MARIRTVKPDLWINERVAACSVTAVVTYIGLFTQADDHGRHRDNAAIITGVLWPLRSEHTPVHVEDDLQQLAEAGLICRYAGCDGKRYLHITGWFEHQRIERPSQSRLPVCTDHHAQDRCGPCKGVCTASSPHGGLPAAEVAVNPHRHLTDTSTQVERPGAAVSQASAGRQEALLDLPAPIAASTGESAGQTGAGGESPQLHRNTGEASPSGSRILDPGSSPTGRTAPATPTGANDLVAEYVRSCDERPPGSLLGHLGREVKKLLDEGIAVDHVRAGLTRYGEIQGHPSRLPSLVNDAMNRPRHRTGTPAHQPWTNPADAASAYAEEL